MVLVDPNVLERVQQIQSAQPDTLSRMDQEMHSVLNLKNMNDAEKWTMYNQILQRYLNILNHNRKPLEVPIMESQTKNVPSQLPVAANADGESVEFTDILSTIPKQSKTKASTLLQKLKDAGVTWDSRGVVNTGSKHISGSNIIDLINDIVRNTKTEPIGWPEFADVLRDLNIPRILIVNQKRLAYINQSRTRSETSSTDAGLGLKPIGSSSPTSPVSLYEDPEQFTPQPSSQTKRQRLKWAKFSLK
ncbi:hypothetical protein Zmor_002415 [Zophobas morio]|uniref:Uncharacterized protein n=1 Tax=Zophobas morio TaxID=2755281 RepID=A0AA38JBI6_9CUCU|nr:hypothetical protein Zmor_002415 [Zophobas morio]